MSSDTEIVLGTYEEFLIGYRIKISEDDDVELVQSFATHAHTGSVKSVSSAGRYLASGGTDDKIVVHDMKSRTENRALLSHEGTVNSIVFSKCGTHLFSGGSDGSFCATRTGNWQTEKHWPKAHKGSAVTCVAIHPSNKLALTIGDDKTLRTWNLIKGRQAYVTNLNSKGTAFPLSVIWSPEGQHFSLTGYNDVSVWTVANAGIERILKCENKSICMVWISEDLAAVGLENGQIIIFDLESENKYTFDAHSRRVKAIAFENSFLFSASSSGEFKVWKFDKNTMTLEEKKCLNVGCRITCATLVKPVEVKVENDDSDPEIVQEEMNGNKIKRKKVSQNVGEEEPAVKSKKIKPLSYVSVTTEENEDNETVETSSERKKKKKKPKRKGKSG